MRHLLPCVAAVLTIVVSQPGGAFAQQAVPADPSALVIYSAQHASLSQDWINGFTRDTGINVILRQGDDMEMANLLLLEGDTSPADIFLTENAPAMALLDSEGRLVKVDEDTLAQVPAEFRASNGDWVGIAARTTVFAYNPNRISEDQLPNSLLDLADPSWRGRWGAAPGGADFQAIVSAMIQLRGADATESWLRGLKANAVIYRSNGAAMRGVNVGEVDGAVIYHYYYFGDRAGTGENTGNVALHYFGNQDPGAFVSVSAGGILTSSRHEEAAQAFLRWLTGEGGQAVLRDGDSFEYAVGIGARSNPALVPLRELDYPLVDQSLLNGAEVIQLMTNAGLF